MNLSLIAPIELGDLGGAGKARAITLEVTAKGGHDRGGVGEDYLKAEAGESEASRPTAGAELDSALTGEGEEVGVGVRAGNGEPAIEELGKDEGARPDGGADMHGSIVLLEDEVGAADGEGYRRRVGEAHWRGVRETAMERDGGNGLLSS